MFSAQSSLHSFTNVFQERYMSESAAVTSSVFKENVTINLQTDISLKTEVNDRNIWNFVPSIWYLIPNGVLLKMDACFGSSYLSKLEFSTIKTVESKYRRSLTDKHINDCMRLAIAKYTPNYYTLVEET